MYFLKSSYASCCNSGCRVFSSLWTITKARNALAAARKTPYSALMNCQKVSQTVSTWSWYFSPATRVVGAKTRTRFRQRELPSAIFWVQFARIFQIGPGELRILQVWRIQRLAFSVTKKHSDHKLAWPYVLKRFPRLVQGNLGCEIPNWSGFTLPGV